MSEANQPTFKVGAIVSADLTIGNTAETLSFYQQVIGWGVEGLPMQDEAGEYEDYVTKDEAGGWVGGICHKRGPNADLPPSWIVYIAVADIDESLQRCAALGGKVLKRVVADDGTVHYGLIQDPNGAILGLVKAS